MLDSDLAEAETTIREAIRIDPEAAVFHQTLAEILLHLERRPEALDAAERARTLAPYDAQITATYAHALAAVGRTADAERAARDALAIEPEEERANHVLGLVSLNRGESQDAIAGFREALRLDPTDEQAREGLMLALKARQPVYATLLQFFLWQRRLPTGAQWAVLLAPLVVGRVIRSAGDSVWFYPLAAVFIGFVVLTWAADPLMTLALLATHEGRRVVGRDSRVAAALFAGCITAAGAAAVAAAASDAHFLIVTFGFVVFALAAGNVDGLAPRRRTAVYAAAVALGVVAVVDVVIVVAGGGYGAQIVPAMVLILGAAASLWYVRLAG